MNPSSGSKVRAEVISGLREWEFSGMILSPEEKEARAAESLILDTR
jgi:hypothetical protein